MMNDVNSYIDAFRRVEAEMDRQLLAALRLESAAGIYRDSAFLKLYNRDWTNPGTDPLTAETRIFFSVWVTGHSIISGRLNYNIHALKLRKLAGYRIESRKFAGSFRKRFAPHLQQWENISIDFGPLTLMQGWCSYVPQRFEAVTLDLAQRFIPIAGLVDQTLAEFK